MLRRARLCPRRLRPASPNGLNPKEFTVAERLKEHGYATQCVGKWHLGDQPEFLPTRQGFDHYLGIPYSNDMQRKSKETGERIVPLVRDDKVAELLTDAQQSRIVSATPTKPSASSGPTRTNRSSSICRTRLSTLPSTPARNSAASPPTAASGTGLRKWTGASAGCWTLCAS